ncbi:potassium-transporting ATPase subunit KdpC [Nocardioides marmoriginsengisoli]|uniref:Potassium-transporting ATPase KdpC subunit n=1 Tax=Nocardioides marmoriginsengisoli TaxID=661483 RepID=A0A3N0CG65_9ACTN|nr:potassium-transporting ATPase subunit KdpC [Nocardioides marmoriginsengisoli]RNL62006.1 potassium-transporting ATPase subunit KdpC [Nocardioides marmoriginsengisoli]
MFTSVLRQLTPALRAMVVLTVLLGLAYPLALTGFAQVVVPGRADGSLVKRDGVVVGSSLIGQSFADQPQYFQSRPSAAGDGYDPLASSASNLGPESPDLLAAINERRTAAAALDGTPPADVAPDALEASGSGLDPHISPRYAGQQVDRVARERGLSESAVRRLVEKYTSGRTIGFLGEPRVNVLLLNLALDRASGTAD